MWLWLGVGILAVASAFIFVTPRKYTRRIQPNCLELPFCTQDVNGCDEVAGISRNSRFDCDDQKPVLSSSRHTYSIKKNTFAARSPYGATNQEAVATVKAAQLYSFM